MSTRKLKTETLKAEIEGGNNGSRSGRLPQRRGGAEFSTQAEVFHEESVFAVLGFTPQVIDDDFAHPKCNLFPCPAFLRRQSRREIWFVSHDPTGHIAYAAERTGELSPKFACALCRQVSDGDRDRSGNQNRYARRIGAKGQRGGHAEKNCATKQAGTQPRWSRKLKPGGAEIRREVSNKFPSLRTVQQVSESCGWNDRFSRKSASTHQQLPKSIESTVTQAGARISVRHLSPYQVDEMPRCPNRFRFRIRDTNIEGLFDGHHDFNGVQTHTASCPVLMRAVKANRPDACVLESHQKCWTARACAALRLTKRRRFAD